ncbi:MAG: hypothetical protein ACO201_01390 [Rickettsiales bacterium]
MRIIEPSQTTKDLVLESESEKINSKFNIEYENEKNINIDLKALYGTNNNLVKFKLNSNSLIEFYLKFKTDNEGDKSSYIVFNDKTVSFDKVKVDDKDLPSEVKGEILSIFEIGNFLKTHFPKALQTQINQKTEAEALSPSSRVSDVSAGHLRKAKTNSREFNY